ncbi:MAG: NAD(P)-dependent alcohol dehydrogenase [Candidatus Dormibacteraeota bacterium]|nr:NAD(P)-dependent alcohol dehydrogenase [Candidatus Dormibacteraeota bacterium]
MRAAVVDQFGPPDVVHIEGIEPPDPKADELLIRVVHATLNRTDTGFRSGTPLLARPAMGVLRPRWRVLGTEFCGEVAGTGSAVTGFRNGDAVFGINPWRFGTHAEYVCVPAAGTVAPKPEALNNEEAAAVCDGGLLALMNLRDARLGAGQRVVVYGASGAIGSAGVQIAKNLRATVTAVTSTANVDLVRGLEPDEVIDYEQTDFTKNREAYDVIFDAVGKLSFARCRPALKPGGRHVPTDGVRNMLLAASHLAVGGRRAVMALPPRYRKQDVLFLKQLIDAGRFRPLIDRVYALDDIVAAHRYVDTGQKLGNVVISVAAPPVS